MSKTNEPKLTNKDVQEVVKQFAYQSESNIVFGFVAHKDSEDNNVSLFVSGESADILATLVGLMHSHDDIKEIVTTASEIIKIIKL